MMIVKMNLNQVHHLEALDEIIIVRGSHIHH